MSDERYRELVKAGAPELPDGWFYRIRWDRGDLGPDLIVQVRRRGRVKSHHLARKEYRIFDTLEVGSDGSIRVNWPDRQWMSPLEFTANACCAAFNAVRAGERTAAAYRAAREGFEFFEGDHP